MKNKIIKNNNKIDNGDLTQTIIIIAGLAIAAIIVIEGKGEKIADLPSTTKRIQ